MLKIENVEIAGWEAAIRGMRNPKNSWDRSDSWFEDEDGDYYKIPNRDPDYRFGMLKVGSLEEIGSNDKELMLNLAKGGPVHAKYRRMIVVWLDITAPLYWWKEFDTYKVGTVANSCSTMHKIHDKEFTLEDFSCEHLQGPCVVHLEQTIKFLNYYRELFNGTVEHDRRDGLNGEKVKKDWWWQMIQLLPSSYNQKRTICLNYEVLHHIYHDRRAHKLNEWHVVCDWIESLPYSEIMTQKVVGIDG